MYWAAHNKNAIYGLGSSPELAEADAREVLQPHPSRANLLLIEQCTDRLGEAIVKHGGDTPWTYRHGLMDTEE